MQENADKPNEQQDVIADYANNLQELEIRGYENTVKKARNALFWAGGLIFAWEMIAMLREGMGFEPIVFAFAFIIGGIFVALAFWTKKKPFTALIAGLILFIIYNAFVVYVNGIMEGGVGVAKALFSGIIIKVVILYHLITPIKDAKALQEAKKNKF